MILRLGSVLLPLALVAAIAASCGGGSGGSTTVSAPAGEAKVSAGDDDTAGDAGAADATGATGAGDETPMAASSPIGAFFAEDGGFEAALAEYRITVEEAIVVCMAAQGFEFSRSTARVDEVQQLQNDLSTREWTAQYGYGISTSFDSVAQGQASDPNAEILFSLSAAERELWVEALTGGQNLTAAQGDFGARPLEEQGCIGQALIDTGGQDAIEGLERFGEAYDEAEQALFDRREMIDAVDAWARCLGEAGYPGYADLEDPRDDIADRFREINTPLQAALGDLTPEEGQALISGESLDIDDLPGLDVEALRALQAAEIELALADLDCYEAHVAAVYEPLRDDFEQGLLTDYATELAALRTLGS